MIKISFKKMFIHCLIISDGIGQSTNAAPAFTQQQLDNKGINYPILPSAPQSQIPVYPSYGSLEGVVIAQPSVPAVQQIILIGGCSVCRIGVLEEDYSCFGILLAIVCFPLGDC